MKQIKLTFLYIQSLFISTVCYLIIYKQIRVIYKIKGDISNWPCFYNHECHACCNKKYCYIYDLVKSYHHLDSLLAKWDNKKAKKDLEIIKYRINERI